MQIYHQYEKLTAGQQKLLCFLAFIGKECDRKILNLYAKGEDMKLNDMMLLLRSLYQFSRHFYIYDVSFALQYQHQLLLLAFMLDKHPQWLDHFMSFYSSFQSSYSRNRIKMLKDCLEGRRLSLSTFSTEDDLERLIPLACDRRFHQIVEHVPSFFFLHFASGALLFQLNNDIDDEENIIGELARQYDATMSEADRGELRSTIALYDYLKQGRYDKEAAGINTATGQLLAAFHAVYTGNYDEALSHITNAQRLTNKKKTSSEKGFFYQVVNNYVAVMVFRLVSGEEGMKKLKAMANKKNFVEYTSQKGASLLADHFISGSEPSVASLTSYIKDAERSNFLDQVHLLRLAAGYFNLPVVLPKSVYEVPHMLFLRHELSPWLNIPQEEKDRLSETFGGTPLLQRVHRKSKWEMLLEELTPSEKNNTEDHAKKDVRVSYIVNNRRVEIREQKRKLNGEWGAGKRMSFDTFRRGTDFMDDTDRKIAENIHYSYYYDISADEVLPFLVGSDRVYIGHFAPFTPVTITEEKPYLIIEKTKNGFNVKSNLGENDLNKDIQCKEIDSAHYVIIRLTPKQRQYYKKLLEMRVFPLDAEDALRQFLPKISDIVEVHSELVEGGSTLEHRDGSPQLCIQALPSAGTRNMFVVYCHAKPLAGSANTFVPGKGLNPCVAEEDGVRYQVTRDIKGERENLKLIETFMDDHDFSDTLNDTEPAQVNAEELLMLMGFIQDNKEHFFLEWPKGETMRLKTSQPGNWNILLKSRNGWFEVEGEIPIDDETVLTAQQFLELVAESPRSGFVRLNDTDFIAISDKLRKQLARLESLTVNDRGHLRISEFHASLLGSALNGEISIRHDKKIDELQEKIKESMAQQPKVSKKLKAELRDYQADGYQWMERITGWGAGICLADDMGLGKTVQAIAFLLDKMKEGPALIAAPASVVPNWRNELQRFSPALNVQILNTAEDRKKMIEKAKAGDVILSTYGLFVNESESLTKKKWTTACLDEAHVIKNRETKTSTVVMQLQAKYRLILTGTPVQNHLGELWNLFQFINPGLLGSFEQFSKKYIVPIEQQDNKERSRQLRRIISPFMLRRTKQEVVEELPDKMEINMPVELSDEEMAVYEVIRRKAKQMLEDEHSQSISINTLAEITKLRQAACSAQLVEKSWNGDSSKVKMVTELVDDIVGGGNSVLVFSQFTSFLAMVRQAFDAAKLPYLYLDGSVPMRKREQLVRQFQQGECPIFIVSLKAGGLGLNLTCANYVVHLDPWWNPAIEQQATDRAYRIGQKQNVTVYHLISQHTIEEKILRLHDTKRNLADTMLEGSNQSHKLTAKDLLEMLG